MDKPFVGMMISLSGRLSRTHVCNMLFGESDYHVGIVSKNYSLQQYWKTKIEKNGGKVANSVIGNWPYLIMN